MSPEESRKLFEAGHITLVQHETNIAAWNALKREAEANADRSRTDEIKQKVLEAPLQAKARIVKEEVFNQNFLAALCDDSFERIEKSKVAKRLRYATRGAGVDLG